MKRIRSRDSRNLFFRNGRWWVVIQIRGKRFNREAGATEAQARKFRDALKVWKREGNAGGEPRAPEGQPLRFKDLAKDYLTLYAKNKRSFERDERSMKLLGGFFSGWLARDINALAVAQYRASREGKSAATINRELACLRTTLYKAVEWGKLGVYPLPTKGLLKREAEFHPRILEPAEARAIVNTADPRWCRPAIITFLNTGLRKMELLKLKRADVDFKKMTLTVTAPNAKNGKARTLPINHLVAETLQALPGEIYFFENPDTGKPIRDIDTAWRTAKSEAGIKGRVRIHDLRDTFATQALRGGVDIRTVADLIGDDPAIALKRYCHTDERTMRLAVDRMPGLVLERPPKVDGAPVEDLALASESVS